jgi:hypothetical protein
VLHGRWADGPTRAGRFCVARAQAEIVTIQRDERLPRSGVVAVLGRRIGKKWQDAVAPIV